MSGHETKLGRFYFRFTHLRVNGKRFWYENAPDSSQMRNICDRVRPRSFHICTYVTEN